MIWVLLTFLLCVITDLPMWFVLIPIGFLFWRSTN